MICWKESSKIRPTAHSYSFMQYNSSCMVEQCDTCAHSRQKTIVKVTLLVFLILCIIKRMLLWQTSVVTNPHDFVIATCIWSELIIYLLIRCNKQSFLWMCGAWHLVCSYSYYARKIECKNEMCKNGKNIVFYILPGKIAYYNLPRGKWSTLIKYMLRWRKRADWW